jgi:hypothetical protein
MRRMPLTKKGKKTMVMVGPGPILANSGQSTRTVGGGSGGGAHTRSKLEGGDAEGVAHAWHQQRLL